MLCYGRYAVSVDCLRNDQMRTRAGIAGNGTGRVIPRICKALQILQMFLFGISKKRDRCAVTLFPAESRRISKAIDLNTCGMILNYGGDPAISQSQKYQDDSKPFPCSHLLFLPLRTAFWAELSGSCKSISTFGTDIFIASDSVSAVIAECCVLRELRAAVFTEND